LKRIPLLALVLLALVVAACSSEESTPPARSSTPEPTAAVTPDPAGSSAALPSFDLDGDPELAGRFPDTVGGQPLQLQSLDGDGFAALGSDPTFDDFLDALDAEPTDVSVAFGGVLLGEETLTVGAFRVRGASADELEREFIAASEEAGDVSELSQDSIGGKDVWTSVDPSGETDVRIFIYTSGDTLYFLTGPLVHATDILEALP